MKKRLKNWITSIIGFIVMLVGVYLIYAERSETLIILAFGIGLGLVFAKDDLIKKLFNKKL